MKNIEQVKSFVNQHEADLYVLPELSDCGYLFESQKELMEVARTIEENPFVCALKEKRMEFLR